MDLLEYQAKTLFNNVGIPVLPSQRIHDPRELKRLQIPYPVVIKSQVRVGGRGKAGGIRLVENTIDAIAAARTIFNLPIRGEYPHLLLAEAHYAAQQELFLAVVQDYKRQCPVLLGSAQGGIQVEAVLAKIQRVEIVDDFSPFYARKLAHRMGLEGKILREVSRVVEKMYQLFVEKDLDLIEINPLGVNADGEVMALDGKIAVNDYGLGRHPDVIAFAENQPQSESTSTITWINADAPVGLISNDLNLALATWDLLAQKKIPLGGYGIVPDQIIEELLYPPIAEIEQMLTQFSQSDVEVVLINCLGNAAGTEQVAQGIATYLQRQFEDLATSKGEERMERPTSAVSRNRRSKPRRPDSRPHNVPQPFPHLVVRLVEEPMATIVPETENLPIDWISNLDSAITTVKSLGTQKTKQS